jgi:hypothetical protein
MPESIINIRGIGTGGINTDKPAWGISSTEASAMSDVIIYNGLATQRRGWANFGPVNSAIDSFTQGGIYEVRATGITTDVMSANVTVSSLSERAIYARNQTGSTWLPVFTSNGTFPVGAKPEYVARAQYQDEILFCDRKGIYPMLRYLGSPSQDVFTTITANINTSSAVIPYSMIVGAGGSAIGSEPGVFMYPYVSQEAPSFRLIQNSMTAGGSGSATAKNLSFVAAASSAGDSSVIQSWGTTWPAVSVNDSGTVAYTSPTITGTGTEFSGGAWGSVFVPTGKYRPMGDSIRVQDTTSTNGKWTQLAISSLAAPSGSPSIVRAMTVRGTLPTLTGAQYDIMRRCPFAEVEVHQECLWGTGVSQYPNRVYYSPRLWDMQTPPELTPPWNGITNFYDPNSGTLRYTEIEGSGDGDKVVALISSDGPLLILTRRACWGAYGTWPNFQRQLVAAGAGCIDNRSAVGTNAYGHYWAGESGIYGYRAGKVTDLTAGRINTMWRDWMKLYQESTGSYVVAGVTRNHLIVSAYVTRGVTKTMTLACNLGTGAWTELSNIPATSFQAPALSSGEEQLIASLSGSKQLIDVTPAISMSGTARDANGTSPKLSMTLGSANHNQGDPDTEARLVELRVGAVVKGAVGDTSSITVTTRSNGATHQADTESVATSVIASSPYSDPQRARVRVGNTGRTHTVTVETESTQTANGTIAVLELGMNVRKRRATR